MGSLRLVGLHVYPVKSLRGLSPSRWAVGPRGLWRDRHWMLVDGDGRFLSQRQLPRMALVSTAWLGDSLRLCAPGLPELTLPLAGDGQPDTQVSIWRDTCKACRVGPEADDWLSQFLGEPCRLVFLPDREVRPVDPDFAQTGDQVGFADGFPFLIISEASLAELNGRLPTPVSMIRFRPNLVIGGAEPYDEDRWRRIRVGSLELRLVKPCSRCVIPSLDPSTAERGLEPIRTLIGYRQRENKVYFGQNAVHDGPGDLAVGDEVQVLE